ncbi:agamous-like MADS-box AGL27 [Olea europaea subsp. europaea]|uniref:Agamous-like MADS-box AGL27 n=1 Tax=Olea europaea subsp. europaea TaxID=158383 RepID=A0A8S0UJS9_OLEEU|nr:agamous-like MADS-box AGL27 [Olea europaea subsp. europaea]
MIGHYFANVFLLRLCSHKFYNLICYFLWFAWQEHYSNYASCLSIVELLQIVERDLREPDIDNLSITDLVHLEEQLQAALMGARSTKTHMMLQSITSLHEKWPRDQD